MPENDPSDVTDAARERQHERAESVEDMVGELDVLLRGLTYPVTGEELADAYADEAIDVMDRSESVALALDRLADGDEQFDSPREARDAIVAEVEATRQVDEADGDGEAEFPGEAYDEDEAVLQDEAVLRDEVGEDASDEGEDAYEYGDEPDE